MESPADDAIETALRNAAGALGLTYVPPGGGRQAPGDEEAVVPQSELAALRGLVEAQAVAISALTERVAVLEQVHTKILVRVTAEDDRGYHTLDFYMKAHTPWRKMMHMWCQMSSIPPASVTFLHGDTELAPDDTPGSMGWTPTMGVLSLNAVPSEAEM